MKKTSLILAMLTVEVTNILSKEANNFDHEDYAAYATTLVHSTKLKKTGFIEKEVWEIT